MSHTHPAAELRATVTRIIEKAGSLPAEAAQVADNLVMANLSGHDSHGVGMVPRYVDAVLEGGLKPNTGIKVTLDGGAMLGIDAQQGSGQITGVQAMELGMARARQHGSCIMALSRSHHLGRIGHFAEMAVAQGLVSLHFVNVISRPVVAPFGGGDGRFGTNPCCIGIPMGAQAPYVLDFATSRVAQGKMRVAYNKGEQVPEGYLIDEHGRPTTDPGVVVRSQGPLGALMTFGEYKGYGLAVACELLGGALTGGGTWHQQADDRRAVLNSIRPNWAPSRLWPRRLRPLPTGCAPAPAHRTALACNCPASLSGRREPAGHKKASGWTMPPGRRSRPPNARSPDEPATPECCHIGPGLWRDHPCLPPQWRARRAASGPGRLHPRPSGHGV